MQPWAWAFRTMLMVIGPGGSPGFQRAIYIETDQYCQVWPHLTARVFQLSFARSAATWQSRLEQRGST